MIKARIKAESPEANLKSYAKTYRGFSWAEIEKESTWHKTRRVNIVYEAIDRWAESPGLQAKKALIFERAGEIRAFSYLELKEKSSQ